MFTSAALVSVENDFLSLTGSLGAFSSEMLGAKTTFYLGNLLSFQEIVLDLKVDAMRQSFSDFPQLDERIMVITEIGIVAAF